MGRDKKIGIGINGFGGVAFLIIMNLLLEDHNKVKLVAINEPSISIETMAAGFNYICPGGQQHVFEVKNENTLQFGHKSVTVHAIRNPAEIPWAEMGVEYVVESTGSFTAKDKADAHLKGGAKKVIVTDISKDVPMYVFGVNEKEYKPEDNIVSSGSLITHQLAPILEVLHERFGILGGDMKILHSAIATQYIDGPSTMDNMDGRPAFFSLIPIFISGAKAVRKILQVLNGSFGIGRGLISTLDTFFAIIDSVNAVGEFLQTTCDSFGIDDGPMITLLRLCSAPAVMNTINGPRGASSTGIIPADVEAVGKVLAYFYGKLAGTVSRGPTMYGSIVDLTVRLGVGATLEDIKAAIKEESEGKFKGILGYTEGDHCRDLLGDRRSSIFNAMPTAFSALKNNHFKFIFCCDNQWGYGCRVIDLILYMDSVQARSQTDSSE